VGDGGGGVVEDCEAHVSKEWAAVLWWDLRGKREEGQENDKTALDKGRYEMEERMKAERMKSVSRLIMFSHEPFSTPKIVAAIRCFLDVVPPYIVKSRYVWLWDTLRATSLNWLSLSSQKFRRYAKD